MLGSGPPPPSVGTGAGIQEFRGTEPYGKVDFAFVLVVVSGVEIASSELKLKRHDD
jgi:hypothetical protein